METEFPALLERFIASTNERKLIFKKLSMCVLPNIKKGAFLDIGAGDGELARLLSPLFDESWVLEPNKIIGKKLRKAKCFNKVLIRPFEKFYTPKRFDLILCSHVLYYFPVAKWMDVVKSMARLLAKGGILVIVLITNRGHQFEFMESFRSENFNFVSPKTLEKLASAQFDATSVDIFPYIKSKHLKTMLEISKFLTLNADKPIPNRVIADFLYTHCWDGKQFNFSNDQTILVIKKCEK